MLLYFLQVFLLQELHFLHFRLGLLLMLIFLHNHHPQEWMSQREAGDLHFHHNLLLLELVHGILQGLCFLSLPCLLGQWHPHLNQHRIQTHQRKELLLLLGVALLPLPLLLLLERAVPQFQNHPLNFFSFANNSKILSKKLNRGNLCPNFFI
eukprot:Pompholyxophrys_punicea_v1_NODE_978_length_1077_cov_4.106654.p2 type:complete len:152 gc:universal NODE_978_length_1077_cov_4.106654:511-966(+)